MEVWVLLGSCFLSFFHLVPVSPDDDLADWSLFLGLSTLTPLFEPVTSFFFAGKQDPYEAAGSDFLQVSLGYLDLSSLSLWIQAGGVGSWVRSFARMILAASLS